MVSTWTESCAHFDSAQCDRHGERSRTMKCAIDFVQVLLAATPVMYESKHPKQSALENFSCGMGKFPDREGQKDDFYARVTYLPPDLESRTLFV